MKKALAMILALAMVLSLAACGAKTETPAAQPAATQAAAKADDTAAATGLTKPVNLTLLSQGAGTDDYITLASEGKVLQENLPAGSTVTQETISSGCSSVGYLIEAGMGDFGTGSIVTQYTKATGTLGADRMKLNVSRPRFILYMVN